MTNEDELYREAFALYQEHGAKFTMDELADRLGVSKKTLYELVPSKEELVLRALKRYFDAVETQQAAIRADASVGALERVVRLLCAVPEMPFAEYRIRELKRAFPEAYLLLTRWLETGWDETYAVMDAARAEGALEDFDRDLFSRLYAYAMEGLMLERERLTTADFAALQRRAVRMLLGGVCTPMGRERIRQWKII
jgi:AcrR family transcriptional regulator